MKPGTPEFAEMWQMLPRPILPGRPDWVETYKAAWCIAANNGIRPPHPATPDGEPFLDACFSNNIFQWDSCFITMWARYAQGALPGIPNPMSCLENFYAAQHEDGAIPREILPDGKSAQNKHAAEDTAHTQPWARSSAFTNPPLFSWAEWEYYLTTGDDSRLPIVLHFLRRYFDWYRQNRRRADGTFWYDTFGSGMDNLPRNGVHGWIDYTCQVALDCECLGNIALHVGDAKTAREAAALYLEIKELVNEKMWDEFRKTYCDLDEDGLWTGPMHIGAYWALLAVLAPLEREEEMMKHLLSYRSFARPNRLPALAAHERGFKREGDYWCGGVWAPTTYMVVRALERVGEELLAHDIACNHVNLVAVVFKETGTIWENYAADFPKPGMTARPDFCGWSALGPITMLIESILGLRIDAPMEELTWDVRLSEEHGIENLRVGKAVADVWLTRHPDGGFLASYKTTGNLTLVVRWAGNSKVLPLSGEQEGAVRFWP